jgi:hypothetical protein
MNENENLNSQIEIGGIKKDENLKTNWKQFYDKVEKHEHVYYY